LHFILINPEFSYHLSYATLFQCSLGRSRKKPDPSVHILAWKNCVSPSTGKHWYIDTFSRSNLQNFQNTFDSACEEIKLETQSRKFLQKSNLNEISIWSISKIWIWRHEKKEIITLILFYKQDFLLWLCLAFFLIFHNQMYKDI
jgi:hypothetical protein